MTRWEQEPISNFRRDLAAEDEFRMLVEELVRLIIWRWHAQLTWLAARFRP